MRIEKVYFNTEDGAELVGLLHTSENKNDTDVVIHTHGMGSNCLKKRDDIIAKKLTDNDISYFTYNNRGEGIINNVRFNKEKVLQGTVFEDVEDSYFDVVGAINIMKQCGYKNIHLQGHSLGSTKTLYTYNKIINDKKFDLLSSIKSIILLSLVDINYIMTMLVFENKEIDIAGIASEKEHESNLNYIIDTKTPFMPLVSAKTFLRYYRDNDNINFARYNKDEFEYKELNNVKVPLFMRWGNNKELVSIPSEKIVEILEKKLDNEIKDIGVIDGASHNYSGKEEILAEELLNFLENI